jgi:hypothetical protein
MGVVSPQNYIVGKYVQYIYYVKKIAILFQDLAMFSCILIIIHNVKY